MKEDASYSEAQAAAQEGEGGGLVGVLLALAPSLLNRYHSQMVSITNTLRLELKLNLKCAALILFFSILLACLVFSSWVGVNALLYLGLSTLSTPLWGKIVAIAGFHIIVLVFIFRSIKLVIAEMGFERFQAALGMLPIDDEEEDEINA